MPMWSLCKEKVEDLIRLMNEKKKTYDELEAKHIHDLWQDDLNDLLETLDKVEEKEEADRLAHGGIKNEGKKKRKAPVKAK